MNDLNMTTQNANPLTLVFVADEQFALPLAVSLASCLQHVRNVTDIDVYLFDGGLTSISRRFIDRVAKNVESAGRMINVHWVTMQQEWLPDLSRYVFRNTNFNETVFYRYAIPKVVRADCQRAIYLDSDVVVREDIAHLLDLIPTHGSVAAVRDFSIPTYAKRFSGESVGEWLAYEPGQPYFNSGVLGINVEYWRQNQVHERACAMLSDHPDTCRWPGQDPLNFSLRGTWQEVDLAWNLQTGGPDRIRRLGGSEIEFLGEPYEQIRQRAKIIHFTGIKPWQQGFTNPERPAFVQALRESGWFSEVEFRRWQARWWCSLAKRGASKAMQNVKGRLGLTGAGRSK
jgi:lipopolysaccharide biosynthesis glycosyltransferase